MRIRIVLALASALVVASLGAAYAQDRNAAEGTPKTDRVMAASSEVQTPDQPPGRDGGPGRQPPESPAGRDGGPVGQPHPPPGRDGGPSHQPPQPGRDGGPAREQPPDAVSAPELDVRSAGTALALLITALLVIRGHRDAMD